MLSWLKKDVHHAEGKPKIYTFAQAVPAAQICLARRAPNHPTRRRLKFHPICEAFPGKACSITSILTTQKSVARPVFHTAVSYIAQL